MSDRRRLRLDTPAGLVIADYERAGHFVERVRLTIVASYLALPEVRVDCPELGELVVDMGRAEQGVRTAELDLAAIRERRAWWALLRDRRPEMYGKLVER